MAEDYRKQWPQIFEEVPGLGHIDAEGLNPGSENDLARKLYTETLNGSSGGVYITDRDQIVLEEEFYHEHEVVHRLCYAKNSEPAEKPDLEIREEHITDEELASDYNVPLCETSAVIAKEYDEARKKVARNEIIPYTVVERSNRDLIIWSTGEFKPDRSATEANLQEFVAHYLTDWSALKKQHGEMFGISSEKMAETEKALRMLDKDSDYDKEEFVDRAFNYKNEEELINETSELPEVKIKNFTKLNGRLLWKRDIDIILNSIKPF